MARYTYNASLVTQTLEKLNSACSSLDNTNVDIKKGIDVINNARGAENISVDYTPIIDYQASVIEYVELMSKEIKSKAQEIEEYEDAPWWKKLFATIGMAALKLVEGLATFVEQIGDGLVSILGFIGGIFSSEFRDCIGEFVKKDWVGDTTAQWYEDGWLQGLDKYSYMAHDSTAANILKGVGVAAGYVILTVCTAGAGTAVSLGVSAAAAAAGGIGSGTQSGLQAGMTFNQAFGQGVKQGAVAAATTLVVGGVANKLGALAKGASVADDILAGADDALSQAGKFIDGLDDTTRALITEGGDDTISILSKVSTPQGGEAILVSNSAGVRSLVGVGKDGMVNVMSNIGDDFLSGVVKGGGIIDDLTGAGTKALAVVDDAMGAGAKAASGLDDVVTSAKPSLGQKLTGLANKGIQKISETSIGGAIGKAAAAVGPTAVNATAAGVGSLTGGMAKAPVADATFKAQFEDATEPTVGQQLTQEAYEAIDNNRPTVNENAPETPATQDGSSTNTPKPTVTEPPKQTVTAPPTPTRTTITPAPTTPRPTITEPQYTTPAPTSTAPRPTVTQLQDDIVRTLRPITTTAPTGIVDNIDTSTSSSAVLDTFGQAAGSLSDIAGTSANIPTSSSPILSSSGESGKSMIPLGAGLGAAALAGLGAKAILDKHEKKDEEEDDLKTELWEEEPEVEPGLEIDMDEEADYLSPTDELAFQE